DPGAIAALTGYGWPGNVRELENVIEPALILARGPEITASDLEFPRRPSAPAPAPIAVTTVGRSDGTGRPLSERVHEPGRGAIVARIASAQENIEQAAR